MEGGQTELCSTSRTVEFSFSMDCAFFSIWHFSTLTKASRSMRDCSSMCCNERVAFASSRHRRLCKVLKKVPWAVDATGGGSECE